MEGKIYDVRRYFKFKGEELRAFFLGTFVMALIFTWDDWGSSAFDIAVGIENLALGCLIAGIALFINIGIQRFHALSQGIKLEYRTWMYGMIIGVVLVIISRGKLTFLAPGGIIAYHMAGHRLGAFRYGLNLWPLALSGILGSLANLLFAVVMKLLTYSFPGSWFFEAAMKFNLLLAIFLLLPIPPLNGHHLFYVSRLTYSFVFSGIVAIAILLYFMSIKMAFAIGILIGVICWQAYLWLVEKG